MSDIIDDANGRAQLDLERAIAAARNSNGLDSPEPTGECLNCQAPVIPPARWCDPDCQQDWQLRTRGR